MLTGPDAIGVAGGKPLPIYLEGRLIPMADAVGRELGLKFNEVVRAGKGQQRLGYAPRQRMQPRSPAAREYYGQDVFRTGSLRLGRFSYPYGNRGDRRMLH